MLKVNFINYIILINFIIYLTAGKLEVNFLLKLQEQQKLMLTVVDLIKQVKKEQNFDYLLIVNGENNTTNETETRDCIFMDILKQLEIPNILLKTQNLVDLNENQQSTNVLILSCYYLQYNNEYWFAKDYQLVRHIILAENYKEMTYICSTLKEYEIYQSVIILKDFDETKLYHKCQTNAGKQEYKKDINTLEFKPQRIVFPDLYPHIPEVEIATHPDQMLPRSFVFYNKQGELKMDGYVGNILETFADRVKGILVYKFPIEIGIKTFFEILENRTLEGKLDVATGVRPVYDDMINLAYPVEFMDFCYMIPLPHYVPINKLYFIIVDLKTMICIISLRYIYAILITLAAYGTRKSMTFINIVLNDKSLRGLLGQSFIMPENPRFLLKYVCFLICFTSIMLNTAYQAYLQSYFTEPPYEKLVQTYEDIRQAGMHIKASTRELKYLNPAIVEEYRDIFIFFENYERYVEERDFMETEYAYTVTRPLWSVYHEKQKLFKRPMYYYSSHLCLKDLFLVAMPVRPGWPYRDIFNRHIMQLRDIGLMQLWTSNTFTTMLQFGHTNFEDLSDCDIGENEITLNYLFWIWVLYGAAIGLGITAFVGELIVSKIFSNELLNETEEYELINE